MIRDLFKDISKYLPSHVIPAIVGIIGIPIITRLFPPEDYGNYVLVLATVSVLSAIASAWLRASIVRFFSAYNLDNRIKELYATVVKLTIASIVAVSLIFVGILFFAQGHISANLYFLMHIGLLLFMATSCLEVLLSFLRARRQVTWYSSMMIWRSVAGLGFGVALVFVFHYGIEGLLWGAFLSIGIALPLVWKVAIGKLLLKEGKIRSSMALEIGKYGFPIIAVNIASWVMSLSDRYILGFFRGSAEVGIYTSSYTISEHTMLMIASLFTLASAPIGFNVWESQGAKASREFLHKLCRYYILIGLPAAVGLSVLAKPAISVLTAPEYFPGYRIVPLVVFGAFLVGITHRFSEALGFYKKSDILMYCMIGAALLNTGLNFLFIPNYGYMAAALTTLIAYGADLTARITFSRRFFVWEFPFKSLGKAAVASAVMGLVIYPIGNRLTSSTLINLILGIVVGVVVYAVMLFLLQEPQKEAIQELRNLLLKRKR